MRPLLKRRLACEPRSSLFFTLYVYPTKQAFRAGYRAQHPHDPRPHRAWVACCAIGDGSRVWRRGEIGAIYFTQRALTPQIIAHEATHAALGWWQRVGLEIDMPVKRVASPAEERFCNVLDSVVGQIHWRCGQAGLEIRV